MSTVALAILIIGLALLFDFLNGMNDAANSIATIVSTRVLTPRLAVLWAAFFNFVAAFGFGVGVAKTIGKGVVDPGILSLWLVLAMLVGAILWTYACTALGIPISVSHALVGGIVGGGMVKAGIERLAALHSPGLVEGTSAFLAAGVAVLQTGGLIKIGVMILVSPLIGLVLAALFSVALAWIFRSWPVHRVSRLFRVGQLASSALFSLGHGSNDAQKTMGIVVMVLVAAGWQEGFDVPVWVILVCYTMIALGTALGGWRVVRTLGTRITRLLPVGGFCAETAAAASIIANSLAGIPVSTTHTVTGGIIGVGTTHRLTAVRWGVARHIMVAWLLTIPGAAVVSALCYLGLAALGVR